MSYLSFSPIWGRGLNPWDITRTTGGSSGGAGAIISSKSAPLAIGSDIGGSIRYPSSYCGIYGFKPTNSRISKKGLTEIHEEDSNIERELSVSLGPMGHCVDDLILCCKSIFGKFTKDPIRNAQPFDDQEFENISLKNLTIGYIINDKFI
jgi:Asp-tRNA(Asn)/Glu-tRNA(Gln) amidotransferase A subunit family amidase